MHRGGRSRASGRRTAGPDRRHGKGCLRSSSRRAGRAALTSGIGCARAAAAARGYFKIEDIEACDNAGLTPHVPQPQRGPAVRNGFFRKDEFRYDPDRDVFACPGGQTLSPHHNGKSRDLQKIDYSNPTACRVCPLRPRCTIHHRRVSRLENEAVLDRMAARLRARPELLDRCRETVEHPFGSIKQWMNQGAFLMRGLDNVRGEFSLTALAYNLRRALNILGVDAMIAAVLQ